MVRLRTVLRELCQILTLQQEWFCGNKFEGVSSKIDFTVGADGKIEDSFEGDLSNIDFTVGVVLWKQV